MEPLGALRILVALASRATTVLNRVEVTLRSGDRTVDYFHLDPHSTLCPTLARVCVTVGRYG